MAKVLKLFVVLIITVGCTSCSFNYYDEETGILHQYGFGYSRLKTLQTPNEIAVIRGIKNIGVSSGIGDIDFISLGYFDTSTVSIISKDFGLKVEKNGDLFNSKLSSINLEK